MLVFVFPFYLFHLFFWWPENSCFPSLLWPTYSLDTSFTLPYLHLHYCRPACRNTHLQGSHIVSHTAIPYLFSWRKLGDFQGSLSNCSFRSPVRAMFWELCDDVLFCVAIPKACSHKYFCSSCISACRTCMKFKSSVRMMAGLGVWPPSWVSLNETWNCS